MDHLDRSHLQQLLQPLVPNEEHLTVESQSLRINVDSSPLLGRSTPSPGIAEPSSTSNGQRGKPRPSAQQSLTFGQKLFMGGIYACMIVALASVMVTNDAFQNVRVTEIVKEQAPILLSLADYDYAVDATLDAILGERNDLIVIPREHSAFVVRTNEKDMDKLRMGVLGEIDPRGYNTVMLREEVEAAEGGDVDTEDASSKDHSGDAEADTMTSLNEMFQSLLKTLKERLPEKDIPDTSDEDLTKNETTPTQNETLITPTQPPAETETPKPTLVARPSISSTTTTSTPAAAPTVITPVGTPLSSTANDERVRTSLSKTTKANLCYSTDGTAFLKPHSKVPQALLLEVLASTLEESFVVYAAELQAPSAEKMSVDINLTMGKNGVFRFELSYDGKGLDVIRHDWQYRTSDPQMEAALKAGTRPGWLTTLPIRAISMGSEESPKSYFVDAKPLIASGFFIYDTVAKADSYRIVRGDRFACHGFPNNLDLTVEYHLIKKEEAMGEGGMIEETLVLGGESTSVRFSLARLPEKPMVGRPADDRVGFFTTSYTDVGLFGAHQPHFSDRFDHRVAIINRRRVDIDGGKPKPITYYVDPTVPERWRKYICEGVERWNSAFDEVRMGSQPLILTKRRAKTQLPIAQINLNGIVKCMKPGDADFPKDYHPMDIRYNSITWAFAAEYSLGVSLLDPRSGEILHSSIWISNDFIQDYAFIFEKAGQSTQSIMDKEHEHQSDPPKTIPLDFTVDKATESKGDAEDGTSPSSSVKSGTGTTTSGVTIAEGAEEEDLEEEEVEYFVIAKPELSYEEVSAGLLQATRSLVNNGLSPKVSKSSKSKSSHTLLQHGRTQCDHQHMYMEENAIPLLTLLESGSAMPAARDVERPVLGADSKLFEGDTQLSNSRASLLLSDTTLGNSEDANDYSETNGEDPQAPESLDKWMILFGEGLADVTCHEVGHTLGLRHNFRGSTAVTWDQLDDPEYTGQHGLSSSVMDYVSVNLKSRKSRATDHHVHYFSPIIGEYDKWAIKYGYTVLADEVHAVKAHELDDIAVRNLPFSSDEEVGSGQSPMVNQFDLSDNPLRYAEDRLQLIEEHRAHLLEAVRVGDDWTTLFEREKLLLKYVKRVSPIISKYIGGVDILHRHRDSLADEAADVTIVDRETQLHALDLLERIVRAEPGLFPSNASYAEYLTRPEGCNDQNQDCLALKTADMEALVQEARLQPLLDIVTVSRLRRIHNLGAATPLSVAELLQRLTDMVWGAEIAFSPITADNANWKVQSQYVQILVELSSIEELRGYIADSAVAELLTIKDSIDHWLEQAQGDPRSVIKGHFWAVNKSIKEALYPVQTSSA